MTYRGHIRLTKKNVVKVYKKVLLNSKYMISPTKMFADEQEYCEIQGKYFMASLGMKSFCPSNGTKKVNSIIIEKKPESLCF